MDGGVLGVDVRVKVRGDTLPVIQLSGMHLFVCICLFICTGAGITFIYSPTPVVQLSSSTTGFPFHVDDHIT